MSSLSPKQKNKTYPWSQKKLNSFNPFPRHNLSVSGQATNGKLFLFGGISQYKATNEVFSVEVNSLNVFPLHTSGVVPQARSLHSQTTVGTNLFVFGGRLINDKLDDGIYVLDTDSKNVWSKPPITGNLPSGRYGHTSALIGTTIYIFGGQDNEKYLNDLISFDTKSFKLHKKKHKFMKFPISKGNNGPLPAWNFITPKNSPPPVRSGHSSCVYENKILIFGGSAGKSYYNDTWCYDTQENSWIELSCTGYIPTPREFHDAVIVNDVMYVFGGRTREGTEMKELGDLCAFRISNLRWYKFPNLGQSPCPRYGLKMTSQEKKVYIFGGESSQRPKPDEDGSIHILDTSKIKFPTGTQSKAPDETSIKSERVSSLDASKITGTRLVTFQTPEDNSENIIITSLSPPPRTIPSPSSDTSTEIRPTKTVLQQIPEENSSELAELAKLENSSSTSLSSLTESRKLSKGKEVDRGPVAMISQPTISQPKVITSEILISQGSSSYPAPKGKIFQPQQYSPTDSEYSSYELQTMSSNEKFSTRQQQTPSPKSPQNNYKNYNKSVDYIDGGTVRSSSPLPMILRPRQEMNFRTKSVRDMPIRKGSFEIQKTIPEESTPPNETSTSQFPFDNQRINQRLHRRTASQELPVSSPPRVLSRRRISIDNYSRATMQELSSNYSPRDFPIRRASVDNYRTTPQIMEFPQRQTSTDNQRTISPITEPSLKRTLSDNQKKVSELPSRSTSNDPKTILPITTLSPKKISGNSPLSVSSTMESPASIDDQKTTPPTTTELSEKRSLTGNQNTISPTIESPSERTSDNDQKTISIITELPSKKDSHNQATSPMTESSTRQSSDDQGMISPMTESPSGRTSIDDQKTLSPITESTDDQSTTSPVTESTATSPLIIYPKSPLRRISTDSQSPITSTRSSIDDLRANSLVRPTTDNSEKIRNIQNILANTRNNSSSSVSSIASIDKYMKRDSFDSIASTESNQSTNSLSRGKDSRPRGARPLNGIRPNYGSPLYIRTDSHEIDRDNLIRLRQKLANSYSNGNFSDSSDDSSIASSRIGSDVVYNDNTSIQQQSQSQSSNSPITDLDEKESEGSIYENDKIITTPTSILNEPHPNEDLKQELEQHKLNIEEFKKRESWFKAELDSARKSGFTPDLNDDTNNDDISIGEIEQMLMSEPDNDDINTDQSKVIEAIVQMQQKLLKAKSMIANQAQVVSQKISSSEKARSAAIQEASHFKAKLETLIKSSESKISSIESDKTKELEDKLIKVVSENKILEDKYSALCQSSNLEASDISINDQIGIDLSRAEIAEKANERVLAQLAALRLRSTAVESQLEESNKQLKATNNELDYFRKVKSDDSLQVNNLQLNLNNHKQVFEQISIAVLAANERADESEKLWKKSRNDISKLEKEVIGLRSELDKKTRELDQAVIKVNDMEKLLSQVQKEGNVVRNMMQESMIELLNISWWDKFSNNVWENAKIKKLEEELAQLKSERDRELIINDIPKEEEEDTLF